MELLEAIKHAEDVARTCPERECARQHSQLAKWLKELQECRLHHRGCNLKQAERECSAMKAGCRA